MKVMTINQAANELLAMFNTRYRVVDEHGETVTITNDKALALFMADTCNGEAIEIQE